MEGGGSGVLPGCKLPLAVQQKRGKGGEGGCAKIKARNYYISENKQEKGVVDVFLSPGLKTTDYFRICPLAFLSRNGRCWAPRPRPRRAVVGAGLAPLLPPPPRGVALEPPPSARARVPAARPARGLPRETAGAKGARVGAGSPRGGTAALSPTPRLCPRHPCFAGNSKRSQASQLQVASSQRSQKLRSFGGFWCCGELMCSAVGAGQAEGRPDGVLRGCMPKPQLRTSRSLLMTQREE